jgi:hypothetical protein
MASFSRGFYFAASTSIRNGLISGRYLCGLTEINSGTGAEEYLRGRDRDRRSPGLVRLTTSVVGFGSVVSVAEHSY